MTRLLVAPATLLILIVTGCGQHHDSEKPKESVAFRVGEAAHAVAKETGKVAATAGKKLAVGAKEAGEGWKHSAEKDREKGK